MNAFNTKPIKIFFALLLIIKVSNGFSQANQESLDNELVMLETKVALSKNYLKISGYTTVTAWTTLLIFPNFISLGTGISGLFTTPYHFIRHRKFVKKLKAYNKEKEEKKIK